MYKPETVQTVQTGECTNRTPNLEAIMQLPDLFTNMQYQSAKLVNPHIFDENRLKALHADRAKVTHEEFCR